MTEARQMDIFDYIGKPRTLNDYWSAELSGKPIRLTSYELQAAQAKLGRMCSYWFHITENKCCGCYPILKQTKHIHKPLCYAECIVCGKRTKPVDDYSWKETVRRWDAGETVC